MAGPEIEDTDAEDCDVPKVDEKALSTAALAADPAA